MKRIELSLPLVGLIAGTRGMLGAGLGLLLADRLSGDQRKAVGWTLVAVGALTTLPLIAQVLGEERQNEESWVKPLTRRRTEARAESP